MSAYSKRYGWRADAPDHRDFKYSAPTPVLQDLPAAVDLRSGMPPIDDQEDLGSCTAQAIAAACEYADKKFGTDKVTKPSRLFVYYNERLIEGTVEYDSGAQLRDGMKAINRYGYPDEKSWPYDIRKFRRKPTQSVYVEAKRDLITQYSSVPQDAAHLKGCLAEGFPVIFGFTVYEGFESDILAKTGIMSMPLHSEATLGGHAVLMVGYDDAKKMWLVRNSWGVKWGQAGYFDMPYPYATNPDLASDFWTVRHAP